MASNQALWQLRRPRHRRKLQGEIFYPQFMRVAERFSNCSTSNILNQSQMFELLALPADETAEFIEAQAAAGTPVEDMTVKNLRAEIQQWKSRAEVNANAVNEKDRRGRQTSRRC